VTYLFIRLMFWMIGAFVVLAVLAFWAALFMAWALMWVAVFAGSAIWVAIDETHTAKRLQVPRTPRVLRRSGGQG